MADGLNLGKASFELALNAASLVQGMAQVSASVGNTTGRINSQMAGFGRVSETAVDKLEGFGRGLERFSRGIRGVSPEMAKAKESVYRAADAFNRLEIDQQRATLRIDQVDQQIRRNAAAYDILNDKAARLSATVGKLTGELTKEQAELVRMQNDTSLDTVAIGKQEQALAELAARHAKFTAIVPLETEKLGALNDKQAQYSIRIEEARANHERSITKYQELSDSIEVARNKLAAMEHIYAGFPVVIKATESAIASHEASVKNLTAAMRSEQEAIDRIRIARQTYAANLGVMTRDQNVMLNKQKQAVQELTAEQLKLSSMKMNIGRVFSPAEIQAQAQVVAVLDHAYKDLTAEVNAGERKIIDFKNANTNSATAIAEHETKIASLKATMQSENDAIDVQKHKLGGLRGEYAQYDDQLAKQRSYIADEGSRLKQYAVDMDKAALKVQNMARAEKTLQLETIKKAAEVQRLTVLLHGMNGELATEQQKLDALKNQYGPTTAQIAAQEKVVQGLKEKLDRETDSLRTNANAANANRESLENLQRDRERALLTMEELKQKQSTLTENLNSAKAREDEVAASEERRAKKLQDKADKLAQSAQKEKAATSATLAFGNAQEATVGKMRSWGAMIGALNERLYGLSGILRDIAVGSVSSFIGNTLSSMFTSVTGLGQAGLEAYKSYELLGMSLTALSARELTVSGKFKDLESAQGAAAKMSEQLIGWMQQLAIQSPFSVDDISGAYRLGEALGFTSEQTKRLIKDSVDWASATGGTGESITSVTRALGQMHNTGHVTLEDINQLTDAGLSARDILRNEFAPEIKASKSSLEDLVSQGVLPADRAIQAIAKGMETDFAGGAAKAGNSMAGLLNSLGDLKNTVLREVFSKTFQALQEPISKFAAYLQDPAVMEGIRRFGDMVGTAVTNTMAFLKDVVLPGLITAIHRFGPAVMQAFAFLAALGQSAYEWGAAIGNMFGTGLSETIAFISEIVAEIGSMITYWMEPHSPPKFLPKIDVWGQKTAQVYLDGFARADPGPVMGKLHDKVEAALGGDKGVIPNILLDTRGAENAYTEALKKATAATKALKAEQDKLNAINEKYSAQLDPINKKLAELQRLQEQKQRKAEEQDLTSMLGTLPPGLIDEANAQYEIQRLQLEQQASDAQAAAQIEIDAQEEKVKAAEQASNTADKEAEQRQTELSDLVKLNELIAKKLGLSDDYKKTAEEIAEDDAKARKEYEYNKAADAEKMKLLDEEQKKTRQGSAEWFRIQAQKDQLAESMNREKTETAKKELTEAEKIKDAQDKFNASTGDTAERIEEVKAQLAETEPGTLKYIKLQQELVKLTQQQAEEDEKAGITSEKAAQKLSDAEFEAALATQDRAGKIKMLHERLDGLNEGTLEYEKTLKRVNSLEFQEGRGGGGGASKVKAKNLPGGIKGGVFEGLKDDTAKATTALNTMGETFGKVKQSIDTTKQSIQTFHDKLQPILQFLRDNAQIIEFVLKKILISAVVGIALDKAIKPLLGFIWGLRQFLTWGNAVFALMTLLGYAWKYNLGGLRDVVFGAWNDIQKPLQQIIAIVGEVQKAFELGGFSAALDTLKARLPDLGNAIGGMATTIIEAVKKWTEPFISGVQTWLTNTITWAQGGGLQVFFESFMEALGNVFSENAGSANEIIGTGILGLLTGVGFVVTQLFKALAVEFTKAWPVIMDTLSTLWIGIGDWFNKYGFLIFPSIRITIGLLVAGLAELLIPAIVWLGKRIIDIASWLIPLLPDLLGELLNLITYSVGWLIGRGIPLVLAGLWDLLSYAFLKIGDMLPSLGLSLGRNIGKVISNAFIVVIGTIGALIGQLIYSIYDGSLLIRMQEMADGIGHFLTGIVQGAIGIILGLALGLVEPFVDIARTMLIGFAMGIDSGFNDVVQRFVNWFDGLIATAKSLLGIASPSKVFMDIGAMILQGLIDGFNSLAATFQQIITDLMAWNVAMWDGLLNDLTRIVTDIWDGIIGGAGWITRMAADVIALFTHLWGALTGDAGSFTALKADILHIATDVWNGLVGSAGWISRLITDAKTLFTGLWNSITGPNGIFRLFGIDLGNLAQGIWDSLVGSKGWLTQMSNDAIGKFNGFISSARMILEGFASWIGNGVTGFGKSVYDGAYEAGRSLLQAITDKINSGIGSLKNWVKDTIQSWLENLIADVTGTGGSDTPEPPAYASGTSFARGGLSLVGERGPELVNLPSGAKVFSNQSTETMLDRFSDGIVSRVNDLLNGAMSQMMTAFNESQSLGGERLMGQLIAATVNGSASIADAIKANAGMRVQNSYVKEDHWNLTVNTRAEAPSVVQDFATMRSMAKI